MDSVFYTYLLGTFSFNYLSAERCLKRLNGELFIILYNFFIQFSTLRESINSFFLNKFVLFFVWRYSWHFFLVIFWRFISIFKISHHVFRSEAIDFYNWLSSKDFPSFTIDCSKIKLVIVILWVLYNTTYIRLRTNIIYKRNLLLGLSTE